jgi:predicted transcriptional regulator
MITREGEVDEEFLRQSALISRLQTNQSELSRDLHKQVTALKNDLINERKRTDEMILEHFGKTKVTLMSEIADAIERTSGPIVTVIFTIGLVLGMVIHASM